ncbi:MAG: hypothetical protein MI975_15245 [Cytophagales bacterium]|nr:hypothetical protein [Cytophagales bacterium]
MKHLARSLSGLICSSIFANTNAHPYGIVKSEGPVLKPGACGIQNKGKLLKDRPVKTVSGTSCYNRQFYYITKNQYT